MVWSNIPTLTRIGRFSLNDTKIYARWNPDGRNWITFRKEFTEAIPPKKNLGRMCEETPKI